MNFIEFNPVEYKSLFAAVIGDLQLSLKPDQDESVIQMIEAMQHSIDIMHRIESDQQQIDAEPLTTEDIDQIGDYVFTLLEELSIVAANRGLQQTMLDLQRLSLPAALWMAKHQGRVAKLDIIVNAVATYANELKESDQLADLCRCISAIVPVVTDDISRDLEMSNPMRPWRILNLNWGIVATRSHDTALMEQVFDQLVKNIPADAKGFFQEGMQQMDIVGYPDHVRVVMEKYNKQWGNQDAVH